MAEDRSMSRNRELVLPPRTQAFVLDSTKGRVSVYVGPSKTSLSDTDQLVLWSKEKRKFIVCNDLNLATMNWAEAAEGQYIALLDPATDVTKLHPSAGTFVEAIDLNVGCKVIIPGPITFPLWPGQTAETIDGHRMATNQYVVVRVSQPEAAQKNWKDDALFEAVADLAASDLDMGRLFIIKGTDVSFYIPSTGLEVVPDENGRFVRSAVTLEQLEYSILLDENGKKRYVHGPSVVFPEPTEIFVTLNEQRKFQAIELSPQSGIYVKVTTAYVEDIDGVIKKHEVGDELFITGDETPFYFPRAEHNVIKYGDQIKHHAIAIPEGEGRYVLNRLTGIVSLVRGPKMYLPNPINEVVVRRILDREMVQIMYPNNHQAIDVNEKYAQERQSEGAFFTASNGTSGMLLANKIMSCVGPSFDSSLFGDKTTGRSNSYTPPRTIVLDTKYDGAVTVNVWAGYAVCVIDKRGNRRVELGPKTILLEYDESLMVLELSTETPKNNKKLFKTCYLCTTNNAISDVVHVETSDLVPVSLVLSYRVNFEGDTNESQKKWFDVENYIKVLTDRCRSWLRSAVKQQSIHDFYPNAVSIVKECLLNTQLPDGGWSGLRIEQNNMRLCDVEVIQVDINDSKVAALFDSAFYDDLQGVVQVSREKKKLSRIKMIEDFNRQAIGEYDITKQAEATAKSKEAEREFELNKAQIENQSALDEITYQAVQKEREQKQADADQEHAILKARNEIDIERLHRESEIRLRATSGISKGIVASLNDFGDKTFVEKVTTALGPAALASGLSTAELLSQIFKDTPYEGALAALGKRPFERPTATTES